MIASLGRPASGGAEADCDENPAGCRTDTCREELATCQSDLANCQSTSQAFPATGQDRMVDAGEDGNPAFGAPLSYTDNGDGTVTDDNTKLVWEKKSRDGGIHARNTEYTWLNAVSPTGGSAFLPLLNNRCASDETVACTTDAECVTAGAGTECGFAGEQDWRLPNARELQSIVHYGVVTPSVSAAFNTGCIAGCTVLTCSCTNPDIYWTSTSFDSDPALAWVVDFDFALGGVLDKGTGQ